MKILMVNKYLYPKGGAETYFLKIGAYLKQHGHEIEYFGMEDEKNTVGNRAGQYTMNMDFHKGGMKRLLLPFKIIYSFEAKRKIKKEIRAFQPDIIHMNNINFQLTPSIIDAAVKEGVPVVQTVHDYQMICPNHLLFDSKNQTPCEKCLKASKWNCAKNNCIHGSKMKSILGSIEGKLYEKRSNYKQVKTYICPSYFIEKKLQTNPIYKGKTVVIHNFIDTLSIKERENGKKGSYVLFFGRLSEEKGLMMFLEACKKLKEIQFVVAGTGPLSKCCEGIPNVTFVGFKTGRELDELIANARFSVYPSIWYENCPLSVLESISLGTPVIGTNMGGIPELIDTNKTGIVLKKNTKEELAGAIKKLYDDEKLCSEMKKNCFKKRQEMVTLEEYCSHLLNIYKKAL